MKNFTEILTEEVKQNITSALLDSKLVKKVKIVDFLLEGKLIMENSRDREVELIFFQDKENNALNIRFNINIMHFSSELFECIYKNLICFLNEQNDYDIIAIKYFPKHFYSSYDSFPQFLKDDGFLSYGSISKFINYDEPTLEIIEESIFFKKNEEGSFEEQQVNIFKFILNTCNYLEKSYDILNKLSKEGNCLEINYLFNGKNKNVYLSSELKNGNIVFSLQNKAGEFFIEEENHLEFIREYKGFWIKEHEKEKIKRLLSPPKIHFQNRFSYLLSSEDMDLLYEFLQKHFDKEEIETFSLNSKGRIKKEIFENEFKEESTVLGSLNFGKSYLLIIISETKDTQFYVLNEKIELKKQFKEVYSALLDEKLDDLLKSI